MASEERLRAVVAPVCAASGAELFDLEVRPGLVRVTVERTGGIDLESLAEVSRAVSDALDDAGGEDPDGHYELEVTTPGVERRLRRPEHFAAAVGERVALRTAPGTAGERRVEGEVVEVDSRSVVVSTGTGVRRVAFADVDRAHTVFDWRAALSGADGPGPEAVAGVPSTTSERATTS
ncbi:MAG: ribosome maturation factor RimP [Actinomycetota bacterium]|nr:ribosome maturation factor RimP [Actinomycetota bacterium]